jgi:hypothetical protein
MTRRGAMIQGLNTPGLALSRTLFEPARHCPGGPNFVRFRLSVREREQRQDFETFQKI